MCKAKMYYYDIGDYLSREEKMAIVKKFGSVNFYNLNMIISVGSRVKSLRGIQFRIWATERREAVS